MVCDTYCETFRGRGAFKPLVEMEEILFIATLDETNEAILSFFKKLLYPPLQLTRVSVWWRHITLSTTSRRCGCSSSTTTTTTKRLSGAVERIELGSLSKQQHINDEQFKGVGLIATVSQTR